MKRIEVKTRHRDRDRIWDIFTPARRLCCVILDRSALRPLRGPRPFAAFFHWGPGAGYIGGWSAYFVINGRRPPYPWEKHLLSLGLTRNFNRIPWVTH